MYSHYLFIAAAAATKTNEKNERQSAGLFTIKT